MKKTTVIENSSLLNLNRRKLWPFNLKCVSSLHFACFKKIRRFQSFFFETWRDHSLLTYLESLSVSVNMGNQYRQKTGFPLSISFSFFPLLFFVYVFLFSLLFIYLFLSEALSCLLSLLYRENERVKKRVSSKQNRPHYLIVAGKGRRSPLSRLLIFNYSNVLFHLESKW